MDLSKLKRLLIERISEIEDEQIIKDIFELIKENTNEVREPSLLTDMEKEAIQKAERDIKNGDVISDKEAKREIENWL
ncbi:MAG: hypothetical protein GVY08_12935 [Bacteroidetes bacterium]|jgi:uncharacterized protein YgbK (DUF1537 family)|nr:hypothetical protein [Bacteroidota bacterium]